MRKSKKKSEKPSREETKGVPAKPSKKPVAANREPQTMEELLKKTPNVQLGVKKGETVEGKIFSVSAKEILVDIGRKSFGVIAEWELEQVKDYVSTLAVGNRVSAQVMNPENDLGYVVLSLRKMSMDYRWEFLMQARESGADIEVVGLEQTKGGLLVDWKNLRGFIPTTQMERQLITATPMLSGKHITVKVIEVEKATNRLVLSQKASVRGVTPTHQKEKLAKMKHGDTFHGTISGIAPFGVFVDVDGLEGLVHISEIAWEKVENPGARFKIGDEVDVVVLDVNKEEGKLNLSIKRLTPDPWKNILDRYPLETTVTGTVMRSAPYGVFIQLEAGVEGLLHISKLTPGEEPEVGQKVECLIEHIDPTSRKISLTLVPREKPVGYR